MRAATILLIDNDADSIAIYSMILRHHGYEVIHATDCETGLKLALDTRPDMVISELFLPPEEDGEVVRRLRRDERTAEIPLILLDSIPAFAYELGPELRDLSRLTKPCEPSRLLHEVERVIPPPGR